MVSTTPVGLQISPRHMDFDFPKSTAKHWHGGDAFKSHLFDSMSVLFPEGEQFFIHSVRHYRGDVSDPALKEQIRGFIGQEGHHSKEHIAYNDRLKAHGYDVAYMERGVKRRIGIVKKHFGPERQLAGTTSAEHLTAIMANAILSNPNWLAGADPAMAKLWRWHALEETEHKAVAFDVYQQVCGSRSLMRRAMLQSTFFFTYDTIKGLMHMLKRDGLLWNWRVWRDGISWLWGKEGILRPLVREYLDYFKKDFHPWQHDNLHLVEQYRAEFDPVPQQPVAATA